MLDFLTSIDLSITQLKILLFIVFALIGYAVIELFKALYELKEVLKDE